MRKKASTDLEELKRDFRLNSAISLFKVKNKINAIIEKVKVLEEKK